MSFDQVTSDNYVEAAVRTECSYEAAASRLDFTSALHQLRNTMERSRIIGLQQNALKKFIFYGAKDELIHATARTRGPDSEAVKRASHPDVIRLLHASIGLQTEASELQDQLFAHIFHGKPLDLVNCAEEAGDSAWYVALVAAVNKMPLTQLLRQNIAKLRRRFPEKFSEERAVTRNLAAERQVLEQQQQHQGAPEPAPMPGLPSALQEPEAPVRARRKK